MILLVYNPKSGKKNDNKLDYIESVLKRQNRQYKIFELEKENSIFDFIKSSNIDWKTILISGGDGTVSSVINALFKTKKNIPILIHPDGSTNELALSLGINKNFLETFDFNNHNTQTIDIGKYNDTNYFSYSMSFGNYTHLTYETPQSLKNIFGHIAYWMYGFFSLYFLKLRKYTMEVVIDDTVTAGRYLFGSVSNSFSLGTIINFTNAQLNDGLFEVFLIKSPRNRREFNEIIFGLIKRDYSNNNFILKKGKNIQFKSHKKYAWNKDGEFAGEFDELHVDIAKQKLTIMV